MIENIKFTDNKLTYFQGRNGLGRCAGVSVSLSRSLELAVVEPITSRGMVGNCRLEIPMEDIPAVIEALKKVIDAAR